MILIQEVKNHHQIKAKAKKKIQKEVKQMKK